MSGIIKEETCCKKFKEHVKEMEKTVKILEDNIKESHEVNSELMVSYQNDRAKYQGINDQLEEALKENKQLLNLVQQKCGDIDLSRNNSQIDLDSSCSTMSIVHLQYKYEELIASHHGLLKLLELKNDEIKKVTEENSRLKTELEQSQGDLSKQIEKLSKVQQKFAKYRERKKTKIHKLKSQKDTLELVHNQLVSLLDNQCMEKDSFLSDEIRKCSEPANALLLQEVRKNNLLSYENFYLSHKIEYLKSLLSRENM